MSEPMLPFEDDRDDRRVRLHPDPQLPDAPARAAAVDPRRNIVLEASAGTGKTRVLVERYVNLLLAGVDPENILAITFTRKAAAEMRERIIERLREASRLSQFDRARWRELKERLTEIAISTIDAFCLSLLREFPLEADVDPGFDLADDTEAPRLVDETLDQALRICRAIARDDDDVALVYAQLGERRLRAGLTTLLDRRLVAPQALRRYLSAGPGDLTAASACAAAAAKLRADLLGARDGLEAFLADGPVGHLQFAMLADDLRRLCRASAGDHPFESREDQAAFRALLDRLRGYFLTKEGQPRGEKFAGTGFKSDHCASEAAWKRHRAAAASLAPRVAEIAAAFRRDLNVVLSRGVWRIFGVALGQYQRTLDAHALLDFSGVLERAVRLLKGMDEFAESRFRIESRYRHVLVDEFQDTSRAQWELVAQLVRSWGEGFGAAADALPPSIFIVGDRKQSIYGFRDAEVAVLEEARRFVAALRGEGDPRHAISVSFRAAPEILQFVNALFAAVDKMPERADAFRYEESDRFPVNESNGAATAAVHLIAAESATAAAQRVAAEVSRLLGSAIVRDRTTGLHRPAEPADMAILFRARDSHREFEKALEARGISTYVYKGLGFFDADEVQDAVAAIRYLADPSSNLRAAAFLRSRIARVSDGAIARLACDAGLASALVGGETPCEAEFDPDDRRILAELRTTIARWLGLVDRLTPSELLRVVLRETDYGGELAGPRFRQARENLKKLRAMVRRFENRGYATLARVAEHLDQLALGDESNAAIDARDAVSLMTVHAAKGLEFPVVFVVNMNRGTGNARAPIRVSAGAGGAEPSVAVADYQSEADEDAVAREREETKRLLYVALTRARDRLYLSGAVPNGTFRPTRGSLGEVLPSSLKTRFEEAFAGGADVEPLRWPAKMP
ncbi:MAG TPA: UvrD-helicase domain-containing protein [Vicinamibacterales bacterium]|jgi:ATP-dependent helicase/nuclease subunit A